MARDLIINVKALQKDWPNMTGSELAKKYKCSITTLRRVNESTEKTYTVQARKIKAAKTRKETPLHPLGNLSGVDRVSPLESTDGGEPEAADLSPHELRRQMRQGAVETGRRLTSRR
ncbi:hypothetical protein LCGC14_2192680 [marine sediment metagenome]|uniref:Uncharacterized protein n=1 Tax=marine sediment metagenome TaxID=412755 RepID=A0A0F9FWH6_9ZZZZ